MEHNRLERVKMYKVLGDYCFCFRLCCNGSEIPGIIKATYCP